MTRSTRSRLINWRKRGSSIFREVVAPQVPTAEIGAAFAQFDADTKPTLTKRIVKAVKGALTPAPGEAPAPAG